MNDSQYLQEWFELLSKEARLDGSISWDARRILRSKLKPLVFQSVDSFLFYSQLLDNFRLHPPTETILHVKAQEDYPR